MHNRLGLSTGSFHGCLVTVQLTSGTLMTVRESLRHRGSSHSSFRPQPFTAARVPSANLQQQSNVKAQQARTCS